MEKKWVYNTLIDNRNEETLQRSEKNHFIQIRAKALHGIVQLY